jgi:hypothetical protein
VPDLAHAGVFAHERLQRDQGSVKTNAPFKPSRTNAVAHPAFRPWKRPTKCPARSANAFSDVTARPAMIVNGLACVTSASAATQA